MKKSRERYTIIRLDGNRLLEMTEKYHRRMSRRNQLVIPHRIAKKIGLVVGDPLIITLLEDNKILVEKVGV